MGKVNIKFIHDSVEDNGKTIKENNFEKKHSIPVGTLVEVKYEHWHGDGACEKVHARLWVYSHDRDCDGTPLYTLSRDRIPFYKNIPLFTNRGEVNDGAFLRRMSRMEAGFSEESLKVIELTEAVKSGEDSLRW